jgi:type I restriction enzyme R subunit
MSAFGELVSFCPALAAEAVLAEKVLHKDPVSALKKLSFTGGNILRCIMAFEGLAEPESETPLASLNLLSNRGFLPAMLVPFFHVVNAEIRSIAPGIAQMRAPLVLRLALRLSVWFLKSYGDHAPSGLTTAKNIDDAIGIIRDNLVSDSAKRAARKEANRRASTMQLSEEETRVIVDYQLRSVDWEADTLSLRFSQGARPEKGIYKAIAEWPTETGPADYALFAGIDFIGFIEAKKMGKDVTVIYYAKARFFALPQDKGGPQFL